MLKILQINYRLNSPVVDFLRDSAPVANALANVPGLRWKIWLANENEREGGGIYLFESEAALENFVGGPIIEKLKTHPAIAELSVKIFDAETNLSAITRAPLSVSAVV
jgi:hypothetical protein